MTEKHASLYDLLEVHTNASAEEIEASYRRLLNALTLDSLAIYSISEAEQEEEEEPSDDLLRRVEEAYHTLSDPQRRAEYDEAWRSGGNHDYPTVMVPESQTGASLTVGRVQDPVRDPTSATVQTHAPAMGGSTVEPTAAPSELPARRAPGESEAPHRHEQPAQPLGPPPSKEADKGPRRRLEPRLSSPLGPDTEFSGALLKRLRESADASIEDLAEITKINRRYLHAIEENDFDVLPAPVYVRGFVGQYARTLGLDPQTVAKSYMSLYRRYREGE